MCAYVLYLIRCCVGISAYLVRCEVIESDFKSKSRRKIKQMLCTVIRTGSYVLKCVRMRVASPCPETPVNV